MTDEVLGDGFANRRGKVHEANSEIPAAGIIDAGFETGWRQLDKRDVLANSNGLRDWCDLSHQRASLAFTGERKSSFDFGVLWKILCICEIEGAACWI